MSTDEAWKELAVAAARTFDDRREIVPFVGSGFNAQAGKALGWRDLLCRIASSMKSTLPVPEGEDIVGQTTLFWEAMLNELSSTHARSPHVLEDKLRREVARQLHEAYRPGQVTAALARQFLAHRFHDIVSFNFDRGMHLDDASAWISRGDFHPVYSHARLTDGTRVWYPHGTVRHPKSIQLGIRTYGTLIRELEEARIRAKAIERALDRPKRNPKNGSKGGTAVPAARGEDPKSDALRAGLWQRQRQLAKSWVAAAINAPILCLGLSLGREEWPLFWFLNQRARNHARRSHAMPTFVFVPESEVPRLKITSQLMRLKLLTFQSYDAGWARLFDVLGGAGA